MMRVVAIATTAIVLGAAVIAHAAAPLTLLTTVAIPDVTGGDFDHFAYDKSARRLYVSAEAHHSIEVFDLANYTHLQSVGGVSTPHTLAFVPDQRALYIADGGDSSIRVFSVDDLHQIARIPLAGNPDAGVYDASSRTFFVGNAKAGDATSAISLVSVDERREIDRITLPATNIESMAVDHAKNRLIVNMRDKNQIALIDLKGRRLVDTWQVGGLNRNTAMQLDEAGRRLFVAGRQPGRLSVIDADQGRLITSLPCVETADDMTYDVDARRVYVSGAGGLDVFAQNGPDRYQSIAHYDTAGGKTSIEVPDLHRFFVVHTKSPTTDAGLQIFQIE